MEHRKIYRGNRIAKKNANNTGIKVNQVPKKEPVAQARKTLNFRFIFSEIDKPFFIIVLVLLVFGITMMFSASFATSIYEYGDGYYYLKRQLGFGIVGIIAMFVISTVDYHFFQNTKVAYLAFLSTAALSLFTAFFGQSTADANRWLIIGPIRLQPSELLKIAYIIIFAYSGKCPEIQAVALFYYALC